MKVPEWLTKKCEKDATEGCWKDVAVPDYHTDRPLEYNVDLVGIKYYFDRVHKPGEERRSGIRRRRLLKDRGGHLC